MATSVADAPGPTVSGGKAVVATKPARTARHGPAPARGLVIAAVLVLLALEACLFLLSRSKGSPSWQAGYAAGVRLGRTAAKGSAGHPPVVPAKKDCVPTRPQTETGIRTRTGTVGAHRRGSGDFYKGCVAGYQVAVSGQ
jgi:hypothetical protein